jgi:hypothetical protein
MDSGGYTYVLLDSGENQNWHATQQSAVNVGDVVQTNAGMPMQQFTSKTLNRTFDVIYFSGALENLTATPAMPEGHPNTALPPGHPSTSAESMAADTAVAAVEEGKNIAWIYANKDSLAGESVSLRGKVVKYNANILGANKDSLAGESVSLRGKVVKYNANILGTNFLHIQDGSGDAADGSNDLIVTTKTEVAFGDTVVASGSIVLDKDFGAGYSYPVLIEDATVTVE